MNETLLALKKQVRIFKTFSLFAFLLTIVLGIYVIINHSQSSKVLKTQGIIITDAQGNDRILIGTPIPFSSDRVRTDSVKAWETYITRWPKDYQEKVWNWYKDYNHSANGILFLSETGHDRLVLGDPTPDPTIGKRIKPGTGLLIMDKNGNERSGYSIMELDDNLYRVVLGLDSNKGTEGLALVVDDNGQSGLMIPGMEKNLFFGSSDTAFWATEPYEKFLGLIIRTKDSVLLDIQ